MKGRGEVNTYLAMLIITISASLATLAIIEVGTTAVIASAMNSSQAIHASLQESIVRNRL